MLFVHMVLTSDNSIGEALSCFEVQEISINGKLRFAKRKVERNLDEQQDAFCWRTADESIRCVILAVDTFSNECHTFLVLVSCR